VKLRDVLRLVRPTPKDEAQSALKRVKSARLRCRTPGRSRSGGADKRATFERLLASASSATSRLLRNLRNMVQAGVDVDLVRQAILVRKGGAQRVPPFRYVAQRAQRRSSSRRLDQALCAAIAEMPRCAGRTIVLVDVSGSMTSRMSRKSDLTRMDAAAALGAIVPGDLRPFTFSSGLRRGPAAAGHGGCRRDRAVAAPRQHQPGSAVARPTRWRTTG
jgi:hypothetical protein